MDYWPTEWNAIIEPIRNELPTILTVIVLFWLLCGLVGAGVNKYKSGGPVIGFVAGLLFGPLGIALTMLTPYKPNILIQTSPQPQRQREEASRHHDSNWSRHERLGRLKPEHTITFTPALQGKERDELEKILKARTE